MPDLDGMPEKIKEGVWEKISATMVIPTGLHSSSTASQLKQIKQAEDEEKEQEQSGKLTAAALEKYK